MTGQFYICEDLTDYYHSTIRELRRDSIKAMEAEEKKTWFEIRNEPANKAKGLSCVKVQVTIEAIIK